MVDYYLENPELLYGQPKRTIGDYVDSNGILTPRRFDTLRDARKSHKAILLRSEHPQEYAGVSGLLGSFRLSYSTRRIFRNRRKFSPRGMKSVEEIVEKYFRHKESSIGKTPFLQYCYLLDVDPEEFKAQTSFSLWESLSGFNRTIVADSAIKNKYHIMTKREKDRVFFYNYSIVENGKITSQHCDTLSQELEKNIQKLIESYQAVRNLDHFDPNHCPIMEFQTHKGKDYFLQYHRSRDFSPAPFELERKATKGEVEAFFVRGATPREGLTLDVTVIDIYHRIKRHDDATLPVEEVASFDLSLRKVFPELMVRKRKLQIIEKDSPVHLFGSLVDGHEPRSKAFKPKISVGCKEWSFFSVEELKAMYKKSRETSEDQKIPIHVISDGRKAYLRRVG